MELVLEQDDPKMRDGHIILVHLIAVFLRSERIANIDHYKFVIVELISDVSGGPTNLVSSEGLGVEVVSCL